MTTDTEALVERLLAEKPMGMLSGCMDCVQLVNPDGPEAADTIQSLSAENARLKAQVEQAYAVIDEMLAYARSGASFNYPPGSLQKLVAASEALASQEPTQ